MLLSAQVFIKEGVDVAIHEAHNGGKYDATNVFQNSIVTGITKIEMEYRFREQIVRWLSLLLALI